METLLATLLALLAAPQTAAAAEAQVESVQDGAWSSHTWVELAAGDVLDLTTGRITGETSEADDWISCLGFASNGVGFDGSVQLAPLASAEPRGPVSIVGRSAVEEGGGPTFLKGARPGDQFVWRTEEDDFAWGYLRVLFLGPDSVTLEVARAGEGESVLRRSPAALRIDATPSGFELGWETGDAAPGTTWRVERRLVGEPVFDELALVTEPRFTDATVPRGRLAEWRVGLATDSSALPASARSVRVERPGEWPLLARVGERIDLVTGELNGDGAHVEVTYVTPPSVTLRPVGEVLFQRIPSASSWGLPLATDFDPDSKDKYRPLTVGGEIAVRTAEGVVVRLSAQASEGGGVELVWQPALSGGSLLPRPPAPPEIRATAEGVELLFAPPPTAAEYSGDLVLVVERELSPRGDDWAVAYEAAPGERFLTLDREALGLADVPIVRLRFRQRYALGARSLATAAREVLLLDAGDADARQALLTEALALLDDPDWSRRARGKDVLAALGADALDELERLLVEGSPEAQRTARELLSEAVGTEGRERLYLVEARARGLVGPEAQVVLEGFPDVLLAKLPTERVHGLLLALDRAERSGDVLRETAILEWARLAARFDGDRAVRAFCDLVTTLPPSGGPPPEPGVHGALVDISHEAHEWDEERNFVAPALDERLPLRARLVAERLAAHPDLARFDVGPALALVLDVLVRSADSSATYERIPDFDVGTAELALGLLERYRERGDGRLLDAVHGLYPGWPSTLAGLRTAALRRASDPFAARALELFPRPRVEVTQADLGALEDALARLRADGRRGVDLVLPAGTYGSQDPSASHFVDFDVPGLCVTTDGSGEVVLACGVRVLGARGVVLDGIAIENKSGAALLVLDGAHVVVQGGRVLGARTGLQAQDSDLELLDTVVGDLGGQANGQWALRHLGRGRLTARATFFSGGSVYVGDEGEPFLDRCVIDSGQRPILQAQRAGHIVVRESFLRGEGMGLVNVTGGCIAGVVLQAVRDPLGVRPEDLRVDPRWFLSIGPGGTTSPAPSELQLERSPLVR